MPVKPDLTRATSWDSFKSSHENSNAQNVIVRTVTEQALTIFGLACLALYSRVGPHPVGA